MKQINVKISLARIYYPVYVLGPGCRVGIWMNGCKRGCIGCVSPELQMYDKSKEVSIDEIIQMIKRIDAPIDGFTISGGEPFYRPEALSALIKALVDICDDILIFSGYTIEELKAQSKISIDSILNTCAALIDGPYIKELNDNSGLRGSSNQRCWVFKYPDKYAGIEIAERKLQTVVYGESVLTIGIPRGEEIS